MTSSPTTEKKLAKILIALLISVVLFALAWLFVIEPAVTPKFEAAIGKKIFELPEFVAVVYGLIFGFGPPFAVGAGVYAYAYHKLFIPNRGKLANEQLEKLSEARKAMASAIAYMELFEHELRQKSSEAEQLQEQVRTLRLLNSENEAELERKLRAMQLLSRNRIWFERAFAFVIGILSSLAASYLWQMFQAHS